MLEFLSKISIKGYIIAQYRNLIIRLYKKFNKNLYSPLEVLERVRLCKDCFENRYCLDGCGCSFDKLILTNKECGKQKELKLRQQQLKN